MEELMKALGLGEEKHNKMMEVFFCAEAYQKGGFKGLYKNTLKSKAKAKRDNKKDNGEDWTELRFEVGYIGSKIEHVINLLQWKPISDSAEDREAIADELTRLAEELRNL